MSFWKRKLLRLRNRLRQSSPAKPLALLGIGLFILGAMSWGSLRLFGALARTGDFPLFFRVFMAEKIMFMVSMVLFAMIVLSSMIATLHQFFLAADIPMLLSTPLPHKRLFRWKALDTLLTSSAMAVLFSIPVLIGYSRYFGRDSATLVAIALVYGLFLTAAALLGIVAGMLVPLFISIHRLQPVLSVIGVLLISGVVVILRLAQPERFFRPGAIDDLVQYMQGFETGGMPATPFFWFSRAMGALSRGNKTTFVLYAALLAAMVLMLMAILGLIRRRLYLHLLDKIRASRRSPPVRSSQHPVRGAMSTMLHKEWLSFSRSPDQWSQLIIIAAITVVFILNIRSIPGNQAGMKILTAFLNMGMAAFVVAGLNSRFAFPAMPLEGTGLVHVLASPAPRDTLLKAKMLIYIPPQMVLGAAIYLSGAWILDLDAFIFWTGLFYLLPLMLLLSLLAFRYGLDVLPGPNETPENLLLSRAGITFMLVSLGCIVLSMAVFVPPIGRFYIHRLRNLPVPAVTIAAWYGGYAVLMGLLCLRALQTCRRRWHNWGE